MQVLRENNVRKEDLKARALALKILGKIFQVQSVFNSRFTAFFSNKKGSEKWEWLFQREKQARNGATIKGKNAAAIDDIDDDDDADGSSSESSNEEDSPRSLSYRTPLLSQASHCIMHI